MLSSSLFPGLRQLQAPVNWWGYSTLGPFPGSRTGGSARRLTNPNPHSACAASKISPSWASADGYCYQHRTSRHARHNTTSGQGEPAPWRGTGSSTSVHFLLRRRRPVIFYAVGFAAPSQNRKSSPQVRCSPTRPETQCRRRTPVDLQTVPRRGRDSNFAVTGSAVCHGRSMLWVRRPTPHATIFCARGIPCVQPVKLAQSLTLCRQPLHIKFVFNFRRD